MSYELWIIFLSFLRVQEYRFCSFSLFEKGVGGKMS